MDIELVTTERFAAYRPALAGLLIDVVRNGASVGFLETIDDEEANAYWDGVRAAMRAGSRLLFVAHAGASVLGTVQLDLCVRKNGINRAEVQKLIVHSSARRRGVAATLMAALEAQARVLERGLLYLDTEAGSGAEDFYRTQGYTFLGGLPEYACSPDGIWRANAIYYKTLFLRSAS